MCVLCSRSVWTSRITSSNPANIGPRPVSDLNNYPRSSLCSVVVLTHVLLKLIQSASAGAWTSWKRTDMSTSATSSSGIPQPQWSFWLLWTTGGLEEYHWWCPLGGSAPSRGGRPPVPRGHPRLACSAVMELSPLPTVSLYLSKWKVISTSLTALFGCRP